MYNANTVVVVRACPQQGSLVKLSLQVDPSGVNFAMAGAGVTAPSSQGGPPSLGNQIDQLSRLVRHGIIEDNDLEEYSVALIAFTGADDVRQYYLLLYYYYC